MRVLLFEWFIGGGSWLDRQIPDPTCSFFQQGKSMLLAVANDCLRAGFEVVVPVDDRLPTAEFKNLRTLAVDSATWFPTGLAQLTASTDRFLLIAPETGGCLANLCTWMDPLSEKLFSPNLTLVELTSDKQATSQYLTERGVLVPKGMLLNDWNPAADKLKFPVVIKPVDGAGSEHLQFVKDPAAVRLPSEPKRWRVEEFISGISVSVSAIGNGTSFQLLVPTGQIFDQPPHVNSNATAVCTTNFGHYVAAAYPLETELATRATRIAQQAVNALPPSRGYIGIDIILSQHGSQRDCIVDVNPRLTMSYPRLSKIYATQAMGCRNLAIEMFRFDSGVENG